MKQILSILLMVILICQVACSGISAAPLSPADSTASPPPPSQTLTSPAEEVTPTPTPTRPPAPSPSPTITPSPTLAAYPLLAGLSYSAQDGDYCIDETGRAQLIPEEAVYIDCLDKKRSIFSDRDDLFIEDPATNQLINLTKSPGVPSYYGSWSSDGQFIFYQEGSFEERTDPWMVTLSSGDRQNLTQTPNVSEYFLSLWPGDPTVILITSWPESLIAAPGITGYMNLLYLDGRPAEQLTPEPSFSGPAFSPSHIGAASDRFALKSGGQAYLYIRGKGLQPYHLPPIENVADPNEIGIGGPAWSPNGRWLAWSAVYQGQAGWVLVDLQGRQPNRLLHLYTHIGMGGHYDTPVFSSDSRWLLVDAQAEENEQNGQWVYSLDTLEFHHLPEYSVAWSPEGAFILTFDPSTTQPVLALIDTDTWLKQTANLPGLKRIISWSPFTRAR